ncbi:FxsA family protein [Maridesulfovibrio hydrothermalis]|uniref:FxsA cytoplasmic membrane protein n=1 Tax=Maridesulfovibrio hydrothermalis AM13 = DSM 14728 TaxID=1121451 RepID=L0R6X3_9BACT|nr:FxsA family protein [Maridesulfovibrio hydrothermalis]CCO22484.1 FxsA cytoplasmic membrane protein [Maridesulfovibrio hydrothermalis AM13 = DSM 14728]
MFAKIFIAFVVIPLFDLFLLVQVGSKIGTLNAIALCLLTAFAGASLARSQGMATMQKVRENMDKGITPAEDILDAVIIFAAGLVLLTPGFITDAFGLLLLFPLTRGYFKRWLRVQLEAKMKQPNVHVTYHNTEFKAWTNQDQPKQRIDNVIDIDVESDHKNDKPLQ